MKTYFVIIGVAVALIVFLGAVAIRKDSQLSSAVNLLSAEKARTAELQNKVESLEQEVATLKETPDYYFQNGVNLQAAGNLQEAKTAFEAVVAKFPAGNLVGSAQQRLTAVNEAIAKAEADRAAEEKQRQEYEAIPVYHVEELGRQFLENAGRFKQNYGGKKIRLVGKALAVSTRTVEFSAGPFLFFQIDGGFGQDPFDTTSLNAGDLVEAVCAYTGIDESTGSNADVRQFLGFSIRKL